MSVQTVEPTQTTQDGPLRFTAEEVDLFHREGYVIVRGMVDASFREPMLAATLDGLNRESPPIEYEADLHYPGAPPSRDDKGGRTVRRLKQAHARHVAFTEWIVQPALTARIRQLLGPDIVVPLAHHNCVMTKHPQYSSETGWHQDIRYWSFARPELVSVWLALGRELAENGCLRLIPGSHRMSLERDRFDEAVFLRPELAENRELIETQVPAELEPGDVLFFHCRTLHAAGRNQTGDVKFSVVYTFRPADNPPIPGTRSASLPEWLIPS